MCQKLCWMEAGVLLMRHICRVGKGEAIEAILAALEVVSEPFRSFANTLVDVCAYAGLCLRASPVTPHFSLGPFFSLILLFQLF